MNLKPVVEKILGRLFSPGRENEYTVGSWLSMRGWEQVRINGSDYFKPETPRWHSDLYSIEEALYLEIEHNIIRKELEQKRKGSGND